MRYTRASAKQKKVAGSLPWRIVLGTVVVCLALGLSVSLSSRAYAQGGVVGASTSSDSTTAAGRKSFYDSGSGLHWVFWYTGSQIEYASSSDAVTWTTRGDLVYNTANFSVAFKVIAGTSYMFLVSEANSFDVVIRRGTISGAAIAFDSEVTVLDGSSASDRFLTPAVGIDNTDYVWVAGVKEFSTATARVATHAVRSNANGDNSVSFGSSTQVGEATTSITGLSLAALSGAAVILVASGYGGPHVVAYRFDGSNWEEVSKNGTYGTVALGESGVRLSSYAGSAVVEFKGELYVGGPNPWFGGEDMRYIARWNGSRWNRVGSGVNGAVSALHVYNGELYVGGAFTEAGGKSANRIAKWNGSAWSVLGVGFNSVATITSDQSGNIVGNII